MELMINKYFIKTSYQIQGKKNIAKGCTIVGDGTYFILEE
jgi:hypothetical protein